MSNVCIFPQDDILQSGESWRRPPFLYHFTSGMGTPVTSTCRVTLDPDLTRDASSFFLNFGDSRYAVKKKIDFFPQSSII